MCSYSLCCFFRPFVLPKHVQILIICHHSCSSLMLSCKNPIGHATSALKSLLTHSEFVYSATVVLVPGSFTVRRFDHLDTLVFVFFELLSKVCVFYITSHIHECTLDLGTSNNWIQVQAFVSDYIFFHSQHILLSIRLPPLFTTQ